METISGRAIWQIGAEKKTDNCGAGYVLPVYRREEKKSYNFQKMKRLPLVIGERRDSRIDPSLRHYYLMVKQRWQELCQRCCMWVASIHMTA